MADKYGYILDPRYRKLPIQERAKVNRGETTLDDYEFTDLTQPTPPELIKEPAPVAPPLPVEEEAVVDDSTYGMAPPLDFGKIAGTASSLAQESIGGGARTIGNAIATVGDKAGPLLDFPGALANLAQGKELRAPIAENISEQGRIFADTERNEEAKRIREEAGIAETDALASVARGGASVFPMAAALATRSPTLGAAVMGGSVFGQEYIEGKDQLGLSDAESTKRAALMAGLETVTERIGIGALTKGGLDNILSKPIRELIERNYGSKVGGAVLANMAEELAATESQMAVDEMNGWKTYTPEEKAQARKDSLIAGGVMGGTIRAATALGEFSPVKELTGDPSVDKGIKDAAAMQAEADAQVQSEIFGGDVKAPAEDLTKDPLFRQPVPVEETAPDILARLDERLATLDKESKQNRIARKDRLALGKEEQSIRTLLQEQEKMQADGVLPADPTAMLSQEEKATATNRLAEIRQTLEKDRAAVSYGNELVKINDRLGKIDNDNDLISYARSVVGEPAMQGPAQTVQSVQQAPVAPSAPTQSVAASVVIDGKDLRERHTLNGTTDVEAASKETTGAISSALSRGDSVTYNVEGKPINIVAVKDGMMQDDKGQRWGILSMLTSKNAGEENITIKPAAPSVPISPDLAQAATQPASVVPTTPQVAPSTTATVDNTATVNPAPTPVTTDPVAKTEIGQIHQAKRAAGLDDEAYRAKLAEITGKESAKELTQEERVAVLKEFSNTNKIENLRKVQEVKDKLNQDSTVAGSRLEIVTKDNLPEGMNETDQGQYDPVTGKIYLNADDPLTQENPAAVALHEIAHPFDQNNLKTGRPSVDNLVGEANRKPLIAAVEGMAKGGSSIAQEALTNAQGKPEEVLTHFIEAAKRAKGSNKNIGRRAQQLLSRIFSAIKGYLKDKGVGNFKITEADIMRAAEIMAKSYREQGGAKPAKAGGAPLKSSRNEQTNTPAFKEWFGDSQVVDENGNPQVVYHGTGGNFDSFEMPAYFSTSSSEASAYTFTANLAKRERALSKGKYKEEVGRELIGKDLPYIGIVSDGDVGVVYSTDNGVQRRNEDGTVTIFTGVVSGPYNQDTDTAKIKRGDGRKFFRDKVAESRESIDRVFPKGKGEGGNVIPVYLSISNPKEMSPLEANRFGKRLGGTQEEWAKAVAELEAEGFDGIRTQSDDPGFDFDGQVRPEQWIPLRRNQIKSATGNSGEFSKENPSILKSSRPAQPKKQQKAGGPDFVVPETVGREIPDKRGARDLLKDAPGASKTITKESEKKAQAANPVVKAATAVADRAGKLARGSGKKQMEIKNIEERAEGLKALGRIEAEQGRRKIENAIKRLPVDQHKTVERLVSQRSSENKKTREEAKAVLNEKYPVVASAVEAMRMKIQINSLEYMQILLEKGKGLTNRDVALLEEIKNNMDNYITRVYKSLSADPKIKRQWVNSVMSAVKKRDKGKKGLDRDEADLVQIYDDAVNNLIDTSLKIGDYITDTSEMTETQKEMFREQTIPEMTALADIWLGKDAPALPTTPTDKQLDEYTKKVNKALADKKKELDDMGLYTDKLREKAERVARELLGAINKADMSSFSKEYMPTGSDLTTLRKRQKMTPEIRALLGEITNALSQLETTAMMQGEYLAQANRQRELYQIGKDKGWFVDSNESDPNVYTEQIKGEAYGVLDGLWTTPAIMDQIGQETAIRTNWRQLLEWNRGVSQVGFVAREETAKALAWMNSLSKAIRIKYNISNAVVNFVGSSIFTPVMGGWSLLPATKIDRKESFAALRAAASASFGQLLPGRRPEMSKETREIISQLLGDQINITEMQEEARVSSRDNILNNKSNNHPLGIVSDSFTWLTAQSDKFWVYYVYYREKFFLKRYYEARGEEKTDNDLQRLAAERTKQTNITPERAPDIVRAIEKVGITTFMPYFFEAHRATVQSSIVAAGDIKRAAEDKKNGNDKAAQMMALRGAARLAGTAATVKYNQFIIMSMMRVAAQATQLATLGFAGLAANAAFFDEEDEEEKQKIESIKKGLPLDQQGKEYKLVKEEDGTYHLMEIDRLNPVDPFTTALNSILEGEYERAFAETTGLIFTNASTQRALEIPLTWFGDDEKSGPNWQYSNENLHNFFTENAEIVSNKMGWSAATTKKWTNRLLRQAEPYTNIRPVISNLDSMLSEGEGLERTDNAHDFLKAAGFYMTEYNPEEAVIRAAKDYVRNSGDTWKDDVLKVVREGNHSDERIEEIIMEARITEAKEFEKLLGPRSAARELGITDPKLRDILKKSDNRFTRAQINTIISGEYSSNFITSGSIEQLRTERSKLVREAKTPEEKKEIYEKYNQLIRVFQKVKTP
jgi:hypothetical protein